MLRLQKASFLASLGSIFFPRQVTVQVREETLASGHVEITPVFTINGNKVPPELIDKSQKVLGYYVVLDAPSLDTIKRTKGKPTRLAKAKAAEFLKKLSESGVAVRSKDGRLQPRIESVKPDVSLTLGPNDSLDVQSVLTTAEGVLLDKPLDLAQLKQDEGWYCVGDDLLHVQMTNNELDQLLLAHDGNGVIVGDQVPRFLKVLEQKSANFGSVEKNPALTELKVFSAKPRQQARVDGNADKVSITPSLVYSANNGRQYEQTSSDLNGFENTHGGYHRVDEGWVEISPDSIAGFRQACKELVGRLGSLDDIRGADIPKALSALAAPDHVAGDRNSPWSVYYSDAVKNAHRLVDTAANVRFRLNIVESDGRSLLELDPIYNHDRFKVSHDEIVNASKGGEEWLRREGSWIKVDKEKYKQIDAGVRLLSLQRGPNGFTFPASERERVIDLFSVLGSIEHSSAYSNFLLKLADFDKIDDVPLPGNLRPEIAFRPYQKHGFNWLAFLHRFGLNGILADDMGLGKTLQTLAVVQRAREMTDSTFPSLIICPTSVVNNWRYEVQKFFSDSPVIVYTGGNREKKLGHLRELVALNYKGLSSPLVVTSYDIARLDHEKLNAFPWLYVVVDEGHNIKNPDAQRTKAIKTINGQHKLVLTGTPIQNNLDELWSLFDYAMPGFLGSRAAFRLRYGRNGQMDPDKINHGASSLKERVRPFVLRRLKDHVAKDLPPKLVDRP